jgi:ATP-dependent DNA helicase RecQ
MNPAGNLWLAALKKHFGFDSFRPLQSEIIADALAGRDVFALLPTGGGKSLCFQLPALIRPGLTVVVSPLIALMKDQVDALQANGIAATFLNSSLAAGESRNRLRGLHEGQFRLLYVAPERLMLSGFLEDLRKWSPNLIAVDEAHCISEWGHDFRPEYRQLSQLRSLFAEVPLMALTATATTRVREDIVRMLRLRDPRCYVASFNRPNLTYRVLPKAKPTHQVLAYLRARPRESGIIYCQSRKSTESLALELVEHGIQARPYHAGLTPKERTAHQDLFLRDEARVICATIAFGMGINKSNVRFVIHYDLPKNIEGYYQETGRAGRDGLPSECLLLFNAGDAIKQQRFIEEKHFAEQRIAREQLQQIVHYAESGNCRRAELLAYFGEKFPAENCDGCDNCLNPRDTFDGTIAAQKFLSCVFRVRQKSGFGVGLNHIIEVLTGAGTEKVLRWRHNELSTYGIGAEHSRPEWQSIGRQLVRLGYLRQTTDKFSILELADEGWLSLKDRRKIMLTRPIRSAALPVFAPEMEAADDPRESPSAPATERRANSPKKVAKGEIACDEALFQRLREFRKKIADERNTPAYIVFSDAALRHMARGYPTSEDEFLSISGVGEKKLREFGGAFMAEIAEYLKTNSRRNF